MVNVPVERSFLFSNMKIERREGIAIIKKQAEEFLYLTPPCPVGSDKKG